MTDDIHSPNGPVAPVADAPRNGGGPRWLHSLRARLGLSGPQTLRATLEEALRTEAKSESAFSAVERDMMLRLLRFGALRVDDVMVPRADIIAIDETASIADLLQLFRTAGVSRIPLYRETLDDPHGMVHIKDLVRYLMGDAAPREPAADVASGGVLAQIDLSRVDIKRPIVGAKLRRPMLYVPPSMPAINLLIRMQSTRIHMALVVDEYGGTDGLLTIEDLVEQVVGEIEDEHDDLDSGLIRKVDQNTFIASARAELDEVREVVGPDFDPGALADDVETLGGLVFDLVGRVPAKGEVISRLKGFDFEVLQSDPRQIKRLMIKRVTKPRSRKGTDAEKTAAE